MPKLFVTSDTHGYYVPLRKSLDEAGFDPNNKNHWLISCGDCFDRGPDSVKLLKYLMSLERKILIKGNHDILLKDLCEREFPYSHDKHNGTTRTVQDISGKHSAYDFAEACNITLKKTKRYRELLVNYFETRNYIFVHSWIPTNVEDNTLTWMENWRNANDVEWEKAMWGNPFRRWQEGLNKTGKTIVFGHWHCSTGHSIASDGQISEFEDDAIWEPFIHDNIIGIDRCTAYTGEVNVLVLEDDFLE